MSLCFPKNNFGKVLDESLKVSHHSKSRWMPRRRAELAELVDALDSGSSVRKDFRVQVPGSASYLS